MVNFVLRLTKNYNAFFIASLLFYSIWVYYFTFINLPKGDFYIPNDEFMIPDSGIFAWYGLPSRCMEWPANPMLFFYYVLIGFLAAKNFLLQSVIGHSGLNFFEIFDKQVYDYIVNKPSYLVYGRVFQYIMVMILSFLSFKKLKETSIFKENQLGLALFFILLLGSQTLISTTSLVRPDSIAILLAVFWLAIIFSTDINKLKDQILMVFIFALLISFRTIFLFLVPVVLYLIFRKKANFSMKKTFFILGLLIVLLLVLNPYLFTNTFVFIKAFLGNILSKRNHTMESLYNYKFIGDEFLQNKFIPIFIIFSIFGTYTIWKEKYENRLLFILLLIINLIYLHSALTSPVVFTTHTAPVLPFFFLLVSIGLGKMIGKKTTPFYATFAIIMIGSFFVNKNATRNGLKSNYFEAINWLKNEKNYQSAAIPEQWDVLMAGERSHESFKFEYDLLNNEGKRAAKLNKLFSPKDSTKSSFDNMLLRSFMFDEENIKSAAAFISFQQTPQNQPNKKMVYLFDDNFDVPANAISPLHCQSFTDLEQLFNQSKIDILLTKQNRQIPNFKLSKKFDSGSGDVYYVFGLIK
jgi:hypothetical protein